MELHIKISRLARNVVRDMRFGAFLGGVKKTPFENLGANDTGNSDYEVIDYLFSESIVPNLTSDDVLVDVGCGKGRVINYWLDRYPENRIYGIELDPYIAAKAARRLRSYPNVKILSGDARQLVPRDGTLYYMYNPFKEIVLVEFLHSLYQAISGSASKSITVIYYNPVNHIDIFRADKACEVMEISLPSKFHRAFLIKINPQR